jgi:hypothetical protein
VNFIIRRHDMTPNIVTNGKFMRFDVSPTLEDGAAGFL